MIIKQYAMNDLNSGLYSPHLTSTYTCGVTIASMVYDSKQYAMN